MVEDTNNTNAVPRKPSRVLVVDNDRHHAQSVAEILDRVGYDCTIAASGPEGAKLAENNRFDVVITDLVMPGVDGMEVLRRAKMALPEGEVILVTGHASVPKAVEAMQQGAFNFLEKPLDIQRLRAIVEKAADSVELKKQNQELHQRLDEKFGYEGIIYTSSRMQQVIDRLKRIAPTDATVLIRGDYGTGKELVAQAIHHNSPRKKKPFVAINCGAIPENLVASELFGHVKGAFTDALTDRVGKFEYANGGTLFLDEIGDMPLDTQVKLLRVLEEREVTRVGDNKPFPVNVRVLSATHRNLEEATEAGTFRSDLYFRLKVVAVDIPPLAARRDDVIPLMDHFRRMFAKRHKKTITRVQPEVTRKFYAYDWPGNVRELRNAVETMIVLDYDGILGEDDLPPELIDQETEVTPEAEAVLGGPSELIGQPMTTIERWAIENTLQLTGGNREEAAKILEIGSRTLYRKLKDYNQDETGEE